jgi:hypothetical protein
MQAATANFSRLIALKWCQVAASQYKEIWSKSLKPSKDEVQPHLLETWDEERMRDEKRSIEATPYPYPHINKFPKPVPFR